jgi:hypothetical protein
MPEVDLTAERIAVPARELDIREIVEEALAEHGVAVHRLGEAGTSVRLVPAANGGGPFTLLLDREPPEISDIDDAEIVVELDEAATEQFGAGRLVLSVALMSGGATSTGPIRNFLAIDPILRNLIARRRGS